MKKINLQNIFKKQSKEFPFDDVSWPGKMVRDWKIMVYVFAIGLSILSFFAWKIYLSDQIAGGYFNPENGSDTTSVKILDTKKLSADLLIMQDKKAAYTRLKTNPIKVVDPAL
jgi:hypothetical protein